MVIGLARFLTFFGTLLVGFASWLPLFAMLHALLEYGWRNWAWPYESVFLAYPIQTWAVGGYFLVVALIIGVPTLRERYLDILFGERRLSEREMVSAQQLEQELHKRCEERGLKCPKIVWRCKVDPTLNGSAYGRDRISLTQRAWIELREGSRGMRRRVLSIAAHELGHIHHGDAAFSSYAFVQLWPCSLLRLVLGMLSRVPIGIIVLRMFLLPINILFSFLDWLIYVLIGIALLPMKMAQRSEEYRADRFTHVLGLGKEFIQDLEASLRTECYAPKGWSWFVASHPATEFRIQKLQKYVDELNT